MLLITNTTILSTKSTNYEYSYSECNRINFHKPARARFPLTRKHDNILQPACRAPIERQVPHPRHVLLGGGAVSRPPPNGRPSCGLPRGGGGVSPLRAFWTWRGCYFCQFVREVIFIISLRNNVIFAKNSELFIWGADTSRGKNAGILMEKDIFLKSFPWNLNLC